MRRLAMPTAPSPSQNHLLAALPTAEFEALAAHLELVPLPLGEMLYEPGGQLQHAYFPTTAIVSLHYVMESGASSESAGVGNEGVVGISLFMGGNTTPSSAVVQTAGHAYRLEGRKLLQEFNRAGLLQRLLLRYTQALITEMSQTAACNRHHSVEQQLCRWLLLTLDRLPTSELIMTQELIANMLGVRREGITEAAGNLQRAGIISYRRGHIAVLDRPGLGSRASASATRWSKQELNRLMSDVRYRQASAAAASTLRRCGPRRGPNRHARTRLWPASGPLPFSRNDLIRQQAVVFPFHHRVAFAHALLQAGAIQHFDVAAACRQSSRRACNLPAASVTPSRRTPSMLAINSCVMISSLSCRRSMLSSSQRHSCLSSAWCRLHTAVCAICVISAWV